MKRSGIWAARKSPAGSEYIIVKTLRIVYTIVIINQCSFFWYKKIDGDRMKRTPLYENHCRLGGRMINFGGWVLPVQYTGIAKEHQQTRTAAGLFDVSHMGEIKVTGDDAEAFYPAHRHQRYFAPGRMAGRSIPDVRRGWRDGRRSDHLPAWEKRLPACRQCVQHGKGFRVA